MIQIEENKTPAAEPEISGEPIAEVDSQSSVEEPVEDNSQTEAPGQSEDEESFFDPNSVPEELKPAYKQMQAAFTKKTQEIAQARKESEELKQRADAYSKYEQYIPIVEEMLANQRAKTQSPEMAALEARLREQGYGDDAIEMMKIGAEFTLNQFNQTQQNSWVESQITEAVKLDKRLSDKSLVYDVGGGQTATFGQIVQELVASNRDWVKNPVEATRQAIAKVDALIGKAKTEGKEELSASAKVKAAKFPSVSSSPQSTENTSAPLSIQDAYQEARKELGV